VASTPVDDGENFASTAKKMRYEKPFLPRLWARPSLGKQRDRLAAASPNFAVRRESVGQAGHSDKPVQEPRVKLAPTFVAPAAISSVSSETSKQSVSSWAFSAISVMTRILLVGACSNQISDDGVLFAVFTPR
jgi:hypothetical protein